MAWPERIVSLAPSNTELVQALGLMDRLVGVDDWSDWPSDVSRLPKVGPDLHVDLDRVQALQPDLVLASLSVPGMERNVAGLQERRIPHVVLDPHTIDDIFANLHTVGAACGVPERAEAVVAGLRERLDRLRAAAAGRPARRLYWEWWPKPIYTPGRRNWLTEVSALVGGENLYADYDVDNVRVDDPADVIGREPDWVLLAWTGAKRPDPRHLLKRPGWADLPAVKGGRVLVLEEGLFNRPSPRLVVGAEYLLQAMTQNESRG